MTSDQVREALVRSVAFKGVETQSGVGVWRENLEGTFRILICTCKVPPLRRKYIYKLCVIKMCIPLYLKQRKLLVM